MQVVDLDHAYRERVNGHQIHHYMYGTTLSSPGKVSDDTTETAADGSTSIGFDDLTFYFIQYMRYTLE